MKKTVIILTSALILIYCALSVLGSGGEYAAEKLFYRAAKAGSKIAANPDVVPPAMSAAIERDLKTVLEKYPRTNAAKTAQMGLAEFYILRKKYDNAMRLLGEIINTPKQDIATASKAQFLKGNVYERKGEWANALKEYRTLQNKYKYTPLGLHIPLYIGGYYARNGKAAEADNAYNEAAAYYERIERDNKDKLLGYAASELLTQAYMSLKKYEEAGIAIEYTINNYPSPLTYAQNLPKVDFIFVKTLERPDKAVEIYKMVLDKAKDERIKKALKNRIELLEKGKNEAQN